VIRHQRPPGRRHERRPSTGPVFSHRAPEERRQVCRDGPVEHSLGRRRWYVGAAGHGRAMLAAESTRHAPRHQPSGASFRRGLVPSARVQAARAIVHAPIHGGGQVDAPSRSLATPPPTKGIAPRSLGTVADAPGDRSAVDVETDLSQPAHRRKAARPGTSCDAAPASAVPASRHLRLASHQPTGAPWSWTVTERERAPRHLEQPRIEQRWRRRRGRGGIKRALAHDRCVLPGSCGWRWGPPSLMMGWDQRLHPWDPYRRSRLTPKTQKDRCCGEADPHRR
jgi:hypothetical protein